MKIFNVLLLALLSKSVMEFVRVSSVFRRLSKPTTAAMTDNQSRTTRSSDDDKDQLHGQFVIVD